MIKRFIEGILKIKPPARVNYTSRSYEGTADDSITAMMLPGGSISIYVNRLMHLPLYQYTQKTRLPVEEASWRVIDRSLLHELMHADGKVHHPARYKAQIAYLGIGRYNENDQKLVLKNAFGIISYTHDDFDAANDAIERMMLKPKVRVLSNSEYWNPYIRP